MRTEIPVPVLFAQTAEQRVPSRDSTDEIVRPSPPDMLTPLQQRRRTMNRRPRLSSRQCYGTPLNYRENNSRYRGLKNKPPKSTRKNMVIGNEAYGLEQELRNMPGENEPEGQWTPYTSITTSSNSTAASRIDSSLSVGPRYWNQNFATPSPPIFDSPGSEFSDRYTPMANLDESFVIQAESKNINEMGSFTPFRSKKSRRPVSARVSSGEGENGPQFTYESATSLPKPDPGAFSQNRPISTFKGTREEPKSSVPYNSKGRLHDEQSSEQARRKKLQSFDTPPAHDPMQICPSTPARQACWSTNKLPEIDPRMPGDSLCRQNSLGSTKMLVTLDNETSDSIRNQGKEMEPIYDDLKEISLIGSGSFSDVYLVKSNSSGAYFAMKKSKHQFRGRNDRALSLREVEMYQRITPSKYIVRYYNCFQESGYFCQILEFCERGTLESSIGYLSRKKNVAERAVWRCMHDISSALDHIHRHEVVHMDVKPENVFISADGFLKLGDLGLASSIGSVTDGNEGDTVYVAMELLRNASAHPSADMFSFGLLLLRIILGEELPNSGPAWHNLREGRIPPIPFFSNIVGPLLSVDPMERPAASHILFQSQARCKQMKIDNLLEFLPG